MKELLFLSMLVLAARAAGAADPAGDPAAGSRAFSICASCHQIGPSARAGFGPQLNGIFGRPAGSTIDYKYSPAMKNSRIVWSAESLAAFIKDPDRIVPGTKMRFFGIGDERKVADLLAYLRTFQAP